MGMINKNRFDQLSPFRFIAVIILAVILSAIFAPHQWDAFLTTGIILSIVGNLVVYNKGLWLVFFILSLVPTFTTLLLSKNQTFTTIDTLIFFALFLLALLAAYFLARKIKIIPKINWKSFSFPKILLGFFLLFFTSIATGIFAQIFHQSPNTANQDALNQLQKAIPLVVFGVQTVAAGFFEELTYRVAIFELVFKKHPNFAFLTAFLLFAYMHGPTDLYSWLTYGLMSLVLTSFYAKYRNFYLNMSIHMAWNLFGILVALLVK